MLGTLKIKIYNPQSQAKTEWYQHFNNTKLALTYIYRTRRGAQERVLDFRTPRGPMVVLAGRRLVAFGGIGYASGSHHGS